MRNDQQADRRAEVTDVRVKLPTDVVRILQEHSLTDKQIQEIRAMALTKAPVQSALSLTHSLSEGPETSYSHLLTRSRLPRTPG